MGTVIRTIEISQTPTVSGNWFIPYSRVLLGNPLNYNNSVIGARCCPMIQGKYTYADENISSANVVSTVGTAVVVVMTAWDIDAVGGARIGDTLYRNGSSVIGTITEVIETATTLTLVIAEPTTGIAATNMVLDLWPRNRGNFGPITINVQNAYIGSDYNFEYQPPTTADPAAPDNYFTVDASEAFKTVFAQYQGQPFSVNLEDYRLFGSIQLRLDGELIDTYEIINVLDGTVANPAYVEGWAPISNISNPRKGNDLTSNPRVRMRWTRPTEGTTWVYPYMIDGGGVPRIDPTSAGGSYNEVTCEEYDFLSVSQSYIQLVWLNQYGAFDTWLFNYGEPGRYGGNTPSHQRVAGKSQLARRDFDITQVNRGVQREAYEFNSGMIPVEFVPILQGLQQSPLVFMLPIGAIMATVSIGFRDVFALENQAELIRVTLEDADWEDSLIGFPSSAFVGTVTIANITNSQTL